MKTYTTDPGIKLLFPVVPKATGKMHITQHWSALPPDMWSKDETELFDLLSEHERMIKEEIIKILES